MKDYPKQPEKLHDFCECGHFDFQHDQGIFGTRKGCWSCICPKYKFEVKMTIEDHMKLRDWVRDQLGETLEQ